MIRSLLALFFAASLLAAERPAVDHAAYTEVHLTAIERRGNIAC